MYSAAAPYRPLRACRCRPDRWIEDSIDERVPTTRQLRLGEWPEFNRFFPAHERIWQRLQAEESGGTSEKVLPGTRIVVDTNFDRQDQLRRSLDLVDHEKTVVRHEAVRIGLGGREFDRSVQPTLLDIGHCPGDVMNERALARLPRSVHDDHASVGEGLLDQ